MMSVTWTLTGLSAGGHYLFTEVPRVTEVFQTAYPVKLISSLTSVGAAQLAALAMKTWARMVFLLSATQHAQTIFLLETMDSAVLAVAQEIRLNLALHADCALTNPSQSLREISRYFNRMKLCPYQAVVFFCAEQGGHQSPRIALRSAMKISIR